MQTEWSPERNDGRGSDGDAVVAPDEPQATGGSSAVDSVPDDVVIAVVRPIDDEVVGTGHGTGADAESAAATEAAVSPDAGLEGEEEAHRSAVDAVDELLDEVELALARLDDGTYGRCETCGSPIDDTELAELPLVRTCRPCSSGVLALEDA